MKKKCISVMARGALCPAPTVMVALALQRVPVGQTIEVWADDPATRRDFPVWCQTQNHRVIGIRETAKAFCIRIEKGEPPT